jgi:hypothetical protein
MIHVDPAPVVDVDALGASGLKPVAAEWAHDVAPAMGSGRPLGVGVVNQRPTGDRGFIAQRVPMPRTAAETTLCGGQACRQLATGGGMAPIREMQRT